MRRVSPLVVLRRDYEAAGRGRDLLRLAVAGALGLTVLAIAMLQARNPVVGAVFAAAVGVVLGGLALAARALMRVLRRYFPREWPYAWRQGVANLFRPANQTTAVVLALGFGAFLLNVVLLVQHNLLRDLRPGGGADKPNVVVFDVQPDQRGPVAQLLQTAGARPGDTAPIVPMRIQALKGRPVAARLAEDAGQEKEPGEGNAWALRREYRSTYRDTLGEGETVVAGERWAAGSWKGRRPSDEAVPISVEKDLAEELEVSVGDEIVWDVQGLALRTRVAALRDVDWARFEPNFFVVFPDGPLDAAPQTYVTLARLMDAPARVRLQRAVAEAFPNVAVVDVTQVQEAVEGIVDRVSRAIRFISLFSLATGALVLLGALATSRYQRVREAVLLKTLGATRRQVLQIACVEYLGLGLLGASTALALAVAAGWGLVRFVFEARFTAPVAPLLVLALSVVGLTVGVGLLSSLDLFRRTPLAVLRAE
jgi:putative ABC transport system permease protein